MSRGYWYRTGLPSFHRPSLTSLSWVTSLRKVARISVMAWSATSSMNVSGTLVTGIPRAVAAATSTESTPTLPRAITLHRSRPSMMRLVMGRPLAYRASASPAALAKSSSVLAATSNLRPERTEGFHLQLVARARRSVTHPGRCDNLELRHASPPPWRALTRREPYVTGFIRLFAPERQRLPRAQAVLRAPLRYAFAGSPNPLP